jgi:F0F1-type ATP synthase delta subunit
MRMNAGSDPRLRLLDDHQAVSEILEQLLTALDNNDRQTSYARLDLLWARLAVHIRAEHLHLFPAIASTLPQAQPLIDRLRDDHDFFMRELARGINILRDKGELAAVRDIAREVEKRLATHNGIEESEIYRWSSTMLSEPEQLQLLARINAEIENRPPRFSEEAWANSL